jgi:hypothetical protein
MVRGFYLLLASNTFAVIVHADVPASEFCYIDCLFRGWGLRVMGLRSYGLRAEGQEWLVQHLRFRV